MDSDYSWEKVTRTHVESGITKTNTYDVNSFVTATTSTSSTSFSHGIERVLTAVSFVPMITMVHHRSDLEAAESTGRYNSANYTETGTQSGAASSEAKGTAPAPTSNTAYKVRSTMSTWDGFDVIIGGSAAAMAMGIALLIL